MGRFDRPRRLQDFRAPAAVTALAVLGVALSPAARGSQELAPLLACRGIVEPATRLACFDRETATLAGASAKTAAPPGGSAVTPATAPAIAAAPSAASDAAGAVSTRPAGAPQAEAMQNFGLPPDRIAAKEVAAGRRPADLSRIQARLAQLSRAGDGREVFTLDNGQIWLQVLEEGDLLLRPGDTVSISRGVFHSYLLQTPSGRASRVTRIR